MNYGYHDIVTTPFSSITILHSGNRLYGKGLENTTTFLSILEAQATGPILGAM